MLTESSDVMFQSDSFLLLYNTTELHANMLTYGSDVMFQSNSFLFL